MIAKRVIIIIIIIVIVIIIIIMYVFNLMGGQFDDEGFLK